MRNRKMLMVPVGAAALVLTIAAAAYACTNYVGYMEVKGNAAAATVTVTGSQSWNELSQAMTQSVSSGIAKANDNSTGTFTIYTARIGSTGTKYLQGTLDVNFVADGYDNHTTWDNPNGDCMSWLIGSGVVNLGTVTIASSGADIGKITAGAGAGFLSYASNRATFDLPEATAIVNTSPREAGVCVSTTDSVNGNQAPLTVI